MTEKDTKIAEKDTNTKPVNTDSSSTTTSPDENKKTERPTRNDRRDRRGGGDRKGRGRRREKEVKEYEEVVLSVDRVTRVMGGGRRIRFRALVAIGNRKGKVAMGLGKSLDVSEAVQKAVRQAKKNIIEVPIINGTIPHDVKMKYGAAQVLIMPASAGTGVIAGGVVRTLAELAGVADILSKRYGSANKINNCRATIEAFRSLAQPMQSKKKKENKPEKEEKIEDKKEETTEQTPEKKKTD